MIGVRSARFGVAALLLAAALTNIAYTMLVPLVPELTGRFGMSALAVAAAFSGFALAKAVTQPLGGVIADRMARPAGLACGGLLLTSATIVGLAMVHSGWEVLVWRLAWGVAEGLTMPVLYRMVSELGNRPGLTPTKTMSWFAASAVSGMTLGPVVVSIFKPVLGFTGLFLAGALCTALSAVLLLAIRSSVHAPHPAEPVAEDKPSTGGKELGLRPIQLVLVFAAVDLVNNSAYAALEPVLPLHLAMLTGTTGDRVTALVFTAGLVVFMVVSLCGGRVLERGNLLVSIAAGFAVAGVGLAAMGFSAVTTAFVVAFLIFMATQPVLYILARRGITLVPRAALGRAFGAFGLLSDLGFIVGPLIGAGLYHVIGAAAFSVLAGSVVVMALLIAALHRVVAGTRLKFVKEAG